MRVIPSAAADKQNRIFSFPGNWQVPVRTEMYAFESLEKQSDDLTFDYLAFPWATLIDALDSWSSPLAIDLLLQLSNFKLARAANGRLATVCQHIHWLKYLDIIKSCGVTDLFCSHKVKSLDVKDGVKLHPFPLFPAQTFNLSEEGKLLPAARDRKYLTNFIGAYGSGYYLSDVRLRIFEDIGKYEDILIIERQGWHFDRHVYTEQMQGVLAEDSQKQNEEANRVEYLNVMGNSKFTLCPSGSGPNSIRIFESIQLGSIPVILSKDADLPGAADLWEAACVIVEDSRDGYNEAMNIIRNMSQVDIEKKEALLADLGRIVLPDCYGEYILNLSAY